MRSERIDGGHRHLVALNAQTIDAAERLIDWYTDRLADIRVFAANHGALIAPLDEAERPHLASGHAVDPDEHALIAAFTRTVARHDQAVAAAASALAAHFEERIRDLRIFIADSHRATRSLLGGIKGETFSAEETAGIDTLARRFAPVPVAGAPSTAGFLARWLGAQAVGA